MNKAIRIILVFIATLHWGTAEGVEEENSSTPPSSIPMTLQDCLVYARHHAPDNVINRIEEEITRYNARMSASSLMPEIYLSSNGNISFGRNIDPETNTYDNKKTLNTGFGLNATLPLFDGLVNINNLKAARVARLRSSKYREAMEDALSLEIISGFYNVSYCKAMVRQMEEQLERDRQNLSAARHGLTTGTKSGADVAEMEALVATDEYQLVNQRNLLSKAYLSLRSKMGMEPHTSEITLADNAEQPEFGEVAHHDITAVNPKIEEARLAVKESLYGLRAAKGSFSPRISLNGGISTSYYKMIGNGETASGFSKQWHDNMGQYIGFSVSIPIFTGFHNLNRVKKAKAEYRVQQARLEKTCLEIERLKEEAALDYKGAVEEWKAARTKVMAEEKAFKAVQRRFQLGGVSAIDLSTASTRLMTARATQEGKRIQAIVNRLTLEYYYGLPLIRQTTH